MELARFSLRELMSRPTRAFLTFLSIVIGVAAVESVFLATGTTRQAQRDTLRAVVGKADLEILSDGPRGFEMSVLDRARSVQGVATAVPSVSRFVVLFKGKKKARIQLLGIDPRIDQQVRDYEIVQGKGIEAFGELLLDKSFALSLQVNIGDVVRVLTSSGLKTATVVGFIMPRGGSGVVTGATAYLVLPNAQQWFRSGRNIDQIQLVVSPGTDAEVVRGELQRQLETGVTVRPPATRSEMTEETLFATENGLHMSMAFALLISLFIIYNTFAMAVGERRKQLGILRAIGATRWQIRWMILREALWISLLAAAVGCLVGAYGARLLTQATERVMQVDMPGLQFSWLPMVLAVAFGLGVSLMGAYLPARSASQVQPLEAIRALDSGLDNGLIRIATPIGALLISVGGLLLIVTLRGRMPVGTDVVSLVIILLGCVLLIPVSLEWTSTKMVGLLRRGMGVEAVLAQRQLTRNLGRSTLTIGVLFVAMATSVGMAGTVLDNVKNVRQWYSRTLVGDFFIRASMPDMATGSSADLPVGIGTKLSAIEGIESLEGLRFVSARSGENSVLVIVQESSAASSRTFDIVDGSARGLLQRMRAGEAVIGSVLAQRLKLQRGDSLPLETSDGTASLRIAATVNDYLGGGLTIYLDREVAQRLLDVEGIDAYVVQADDRRLAAVEAALEKFCQESGLILQSYADVVALINGMVGGIIASLWMLLALGCAIAAMGLINTLTMSILEQTREIGMLRVVAMTRSQVRRMVLAQALYIGLLGLIPGSLAGVFVSYAISLSSFAVLGHNVVFEFRPVLILGALAAGILIVLGSSLIPAERAARLKISSALQCE